MPEYRTLRYPEDWPLREGDEFLNAEFKGRWMPVSDLFDSCLEGNIYRRPVESSEQLATKEGMPHEGSRGEQLVKAPQATSGPVTEAPVTSDCPYLNGESGCVCASCPHRPVPVTAASVIAKAGGEIPYSYTDYDLDLNPCGVVERAVRVLGESYVADPGFMCNITSPHGYMLDALVQAAHSQALAGFEEVECYECDGKGLDHSCAPCRYCNGHGVIYRKTQEGGK